MEVDVPKGDLIKIEAPTVETDIKAPTGSIDVKTPEVKVPEGGVSVDLPSPPEVVVTEVPESEMMKLEGKLDDAPVLHVIEDKPQDISLDVSGG